MLENKEITSTNEIRELTHLLIDSDKEYNLFFHPFEFSDLLSIFKNKKKDLFFILILKKKIIGFFMLRGFDAGYEIPSFGVWIDQNYTSKELGKLALQFSISVLKLLSIKQIMLKVHPQNVRAKALYEKIGFKFSHIDQKNNNLVYYKNI